ncbi:hypothetical protein [Tenacibaculum sp.]|uniref:hypothetical protein n=1 Tax=Tenacibaculum sp. TaxID=1906242 RepID=UPI003AA826DD
MKKLATLVLLFLSVITTAQVGIGTLTPNVSAQLDIKSNTKGLLIPRLNIDNLKTASPVSSSTINESLLVYNTNKTSGKGFYYWNGSLWEKLTDITTVSNLVASQADDQQIKKFYLSSSNILTLELENASSKSVDLSSLLGKNELLTGEGSPISNSIDPLGGVLYVDTNSGEVYSSDGRLWSSVVSSGADGKSAYQIWLDAGNSGTEADFITSLKGNTGAAGTNGTDGVDGKSAYQVWLDAGNSGTEADFITSLKGNTGAAGTNGTDGADGKSAYQVWLDTGNSGTEADFITSLKGDTGAAGANGTDGKSAYQVWLDAGNSGTEADFITSLKGNTGAAGQDATLSGTGNPNGVVTGIAGQVYTDTASGILYSTSDGTTWIAVDSDTQDLSLSGNTISLVNGGAVDIGASSLAGNVAGNNVLATTNQTDISTINTSLVRLNNIRVVKNPTTTTIIDNTDGTVIIEQTGLISLGLGADITIPTPNSSNLGNKIVIVNRAGNGLLIGLSVALNLNVTGGSTIKGSGLITGLSLLGINSSITIQCGFDGTNYYWYQIDSTSL